MNSQPLFPMQPRESVLGRRHHFVPQGFLRGFAEDPDRNFVWVYDKRPNRLPRRKAIKSIAWQPDYYSQERPDGSLDERLERVLATGPDNNAPPIIRSINPKPGERVKLTADERAELALFLGLSLTRVPSFRDGIDEMHTRAAEIALSIAAQRDGELHEAVERYGLRAKAKPWASLRPMVESAKQIADSLIEKCWQFFVAPAREPLATSDNPVIFAGAFSGLSHFGPAHPGAEVVMNLRSDLALVCTPRDRSLNYLALPLSPSDSRKFSRGVVRAARHRVFFSKKCERFDAFVKKYAGEEQRLRGE